jgi:proline iminopeptidase
MAVAAALVGVYATVVRPRLLRSGATAEEVRSPFPGSDLVPGGVRGATMAVTIDGPPRLVWPWLVQMGRGRAGWYSWDRLDNGGVPSADRIHPEWQNISVGDRLLSTSDGEHWFEVAAVEPERFLALRATFDIRGRQFASSGLRPRAYTDSTWSFLLKELPEQRTRLIVSGYQTGRPRLVQALTGFLIWEPSHWIMQRRQFTNLKRRAKREAIGSTASAAPATVGDWTGEAGRQESGSRKQRP